MTKIFLFLHEHTHQIESKFHEHGCSRLHCHWCYTKQAVGEVNKDLISHKPRKDAQFSVLQMSETLIVVMVLDIKSIIKLLS
jgi:hypothetical protein